jgi:hypothetical protein
VESANLTLKEKCFQVSVKSFTRDDIEINSEIFKNEIVNYQIIKNRSKKCKNEEERVKLSYFADYVGFMMNDDALNPFFGSILIMYYPIGNLREYIKAKKCINSIKAEDINKDPSLKNINQLIDFAGQIAIGLKFIKI